jgi:nucleotide-binding universal stress UspA family protein
VTRSVVCGIDGSRDSAAAARVGAGLAERLGLRLLLVHVAQATLAPAGIGSPGPLLVGATVDAELAAGERLLEELILEQGLDGAETRVVWGFAADRLADVADAEDAELLVVGSRGRGALKAAFLGSVSTELVGVAPCPVLVVPPAR